MSYTDSMLANMASAKDLENKRVLREQLAKDVDKWLKKNKPTVLPGVQLKPKPMRSVVKRNKNMEPAPYAKVMGLVEWANASKSKKLPRRTLLAEVTGIPSKRVVVAVSASRNGQRRNMTNLEYEIFTKAMSKVEEMEMSRA